MLQTTVVIFTLTVFYLALKKLSKHNTCCCKYKCNTCHKNTVQGLTINAIISARVTQACCSWQHSLRIKLFFWKLNKC